MSEYDDYNDFEASVAETYEKPQPQEVFVPQEPTPQQAPAYQKKPINKKPIIAVVVAVVVSILLIAVFVFVPFNNNDATNQNVQIMSVGPRISLQSLANGNTLVVPEVGYKCTYGYYMSGSKVGEISFTSQGYETYDGEQCIKVIGSGNFGMSLVGQDIDMDYSYDAYIAYDDYNLKYFHMMFDYSDISMDLSMVLNEETGEITTSYSYEGYGGDDTTTVMKMSDDYWELTDVFDELYVGYEKDFSYSLDSYGYNSEINMKLSVTDKTDVTVPAGKYLDCYIVEIGSGVGEEYSSSSYIWVNEDGVVPKITTISSTSGISATIEMTLKLIDYSEK